MMRFACIVVGARRCLARASHRLVPTVLMSLIAVVVLFGCRAHSSQPETPPPANETMGIIEGRVTIGPLKPGPVRMGEPEPEPPPEMFASHKIVLLSEDQSSKIREASIDSKGNFRIEVPPGNYFIDFAPHDIGMKYGNAPQPVSVEAGKTTRHDVDIDTGMR